MFNKKLKREIYGAREEVCVGTTVWSTVIPKYTGLIERVEDLEKEVAKVLGDSLLNYRLAKDNQTKEYHMKRSIIDLSSENEKLKAVVAELCDSHYNLLDEIKELKTAYALTICDVLKLENNQG